MTLLEQYDTRLADALRKFARGEIELFTGLGGAGFDPNGFADDPMDPESPSVFKSLATCLALHRLGVPAVSFDEPYIEDALDVSEPDAIAINGAALAVGDEPIFDVDTARAAAMESIEARAKAAQGAVTARPRVMLVAADPNLELAPERIERFGRDALRLLTENPEVVLRESEDLGRFAGLFSAMRDAPVKAGKEELGALEPRIELVFAFPGVWRPTPRLDAALTVRAADLRAALPGARVRFHVWDGDALVRAFERVTLSAVGVLRGASMMILPTITAKGGPAAGWIGYAPARSIVELVMGQEGEPDPRLFYDNVRHFLGEDIRANPGAMGLAQTLDDGAAPELVLRHNGVTIVARAAEPHRDDKAQGPVYDLMLREFQIVNGAQTAFTLCAHEDKLNQAYVPVKVVVTENEHVKDGVILGANTQAAVDRYDMLSRRPELRALQQAFDATPHGAPDKLWLQRRRAEPFRGRVNPQRVLTPRQLLEGYAATILAAPHRVHDNAAAFLQEAPSRIFNGAHDSAVYQAVGWLIVAGRRWADRHHLRWADRLGEGRGDAYPARYQFLFALFQLVDVNPDDIDLARGPQTAERFNALAEVFATRDGAALADLAGVIVREAAAGASLTRELARRAGFTEEVRELAQDARRRLHGAE